MNKVPKSSNEKRFDVIKELIIVLIVLVLLFFYWMAMLLIASLLLVNIWHILFEDIVIIAIVLTIISGIFYIRHRKKKWIKENSQ